MESAKKLIIDVLSFSETSIRYRSEEEGILRQESFNNRMRKFLKDGESQPRVIYMCGSTRFADLMAVISWEFEKMGYIVLRVNYVPRWYMKKANWKSESHGAEHDNLKKELDELHCRKIDMCDIVFCCNANGYIGESTRNEINYATKQGKPVYFLYDFKQYEPGDEGNKLWQVVWEMEKWWIDATE